MSSFTYQFPQSAKMIEKRLWHFKVINSPKGGANLTWTTSKTHPKVFRKVSSQFLCTPCREKVVLLSNFTSQWENF